MKIKQAGFKNLNEWQQFVICVELLVFVGLVLNIFRVLKGGAIFWLLLSSLMAPIYALGSHPYPCLGGFLAFYVLTTIQLEWLSPSIRPAERHAITAVISFGVLVVAWTSIMAITDPGMFVFRMSC